MKAKDAEDMKKDSKKKRKYKAKKLVLNVSQTKYHVVRYVARSLFKMRLSGVAYHVDYDNPNDEWDLFWTDGNVGPDKLYRMKPYQRINHFPGMQALSRKNNLARNLQRMMRFFPEEYKFFPQTWLLPAEYGDFSKQFTKTVGKNGKPKKSAKTFISKPEAAC